MNTAIRVEKNLNVPSVAVWRAIAGIDGLDRWFPVIATCHVEGAGEGALRLMELDGGGRIVDRIENIDPDRQCLRYLRIEHPFPVSRYVGTVTVQALADGHTQVIWVVEVEVEPENRESVAAFVRQALSDGIDGMERELRLPAA